MAATIEYYLKFCDREFTPSEAILKTRLPLVAEALVKQCEEVAHWAIGKGKELTLIYLDGCPKPYVIESWLASNAANEEPERDNIIGVTNLGENWVFINRTLLRQTPILTNAINQMSHSERPMSLVRERDKLQVAINKPMKELLGGTEEELTERVMIGYWLPGHREALQDRLRLEGEFMHKYEAAMRLTSDGWFYLEAYFQSLHEGAFTLSTNHYHEPRLVPAQLQL